MSELEWLEENRKRLPYMPIDAIVHAVWEAACMATSVNWPPVTIAASDVHVHNSKVEITCQNIVKAALLAEALVAFESLPTPHMQGATGPLTREQILDLCCEFGQDFINGHCTDVWGLLIHLYGLERSAFASKG